MPSKKRPSPLPTLPQTETVEGFTLTLGGSNTYKKVKKNGDGFQGCNVALHLTTKKCDTPKEAALELAKKEFERKTGTATKKCALPHFFYHLPCSQPDPCDAQVRQR